MSRTTALRRSFLINLLVMVSAVVLLQACGNNKKAPPAAPVSLWTWVSGSDTVGQAGNYGTKGAAVAANVPGARFKATTWTDSSNTLWMFGGSSGTSSYFNDLWKFNPASGLWTWVSGSNTVNQVGNYGAQGIADVANVPGARSGAISWVDSSNTLWLFGGIYSAAGIESSFNDLWKFSPTTGLWTWVSGSNTVDQVGTYGAKGTAAAANVPGARSTGISWIDSSNTLWMFGGFGYDSAGTVNRLNDLWKFNPAIGQWTWVSGSNTVGQAGTYGTQGTAAPANVPGARNNGISWIDSSNTLWLFGGTSFVPGNFNDLWKFDGANWTWVSGSNTVNQTGVYGTQGVAAAANVPGARTPAGSWIDSSNTLWLFGGFGRGSDALVGALNDLWKFDGTNWTWVSGSNIRVQAGTYGTKGTAAAANVPGTRNTTVSWIDSSNTLWLFGGDGYDSTGIYGALNDLWRYGP